MNVGWDKAGVWSSTAFKLDRAHLRALNMYHIKDRMGGDGLIENVFHNVSIQVPALFSQKIISISAEKSLYIFDRKKMKF